MYRLTTPLDNHDIASLSIGSQVILSGVIYTGRDAVLPRIVDLLKNNEWSKTGINLEGGVIFHTAVSPAGVGPTSSNKLEIESSIPALSAAGIKMHLGKGSLSETTVHALAQYNSVYAVIPPVTALLTSRIIRKEAICFIEEGMEAMHLLEVVEFPVIIAAAQGESIYMKKDR